MIVNLTGLEMTTISMLPCPGLSRTENLKQNFEFSNIPVRRVNSESGNTLFSGVQHGQQYQVSTSECNEPEGLMTAEPEKIAN